LKKAGLIQLDPLSLRADLNDLNKRVEELEHRTMMDVVDIVNMFNDLRTELYAVEYIIGRPDLPKILYKGGLLSDTWIDKDEDDSEDSADA
jgi:hypothetical protein